MTERITPAEVRELAEQMDYTRPENVDVHTLSGWVHKILAIAARMEADERRTAYIQEAWQELGAEIARLKDALHAYNTVTGDGAYHVWIPDEDNHLESLICPVVIPSEWLRDMVAERDELAATNRLFMDCMKRACRMWQEAHPDKPLVWPDGAKNIAWLLEQNDALAAKVQEYETRLKGRVLVPVEYEIENDGTVSAFPTAAIGNAYLYPGNGADEAEALMNLQAAIDEEGKANG